MGEGREKDEAFVTLATNDTYALGCLVLANSLRRVGTSRQLVVMVTQGVSSSLRDQLAIPFDHIVPVNVLDSNDSINLELLGRPDLSVTFTKLHCWRLTQFKKCVFMDADTLVLQNIDELFDREELSAAPDPGWPDCFNSGVFVYVPSDETYRSLLTFAITTGSFDGGDQGLLNLYFRDWATRDIGKHLPFIYNVVSQIFYSYLPALKQFHDRVKVVHFIGAVKPWHHSYNTATGRVAPLQNTQSSQEYLQLWWDLFMESVQPNLDPQIAAYVRLEYIPPTPPASESVQVSSEASGDQGSGQQQQQRQQDHHGHTDIRAAPTTSYHVLFPYTPPNLEEPRQVAPQPMAQDAATKSEVIDIPVVYRDYKSYETHYAEEPLTAVNPENPPVDHYIASEEIKGPHFTYDGDRNYGNENNIPSQEPAGSSQNNRSIGEVTQTSLEGGDARNMSGLSGSGEKDENGNDAAKGGIVGELANLSISGDEAIRGDRERKLQWEQGQADYMGIDSFDHIRARLDEKIAQPTPSTSRTSVEKETTSKEKEVTSKEKEVRSKQ